MNIKDIIDAERWSQKRRDGWWEVRHNSSLNRIEAFVTGYIKELEAQIQSHNVCYDGRCKCGARVEYGDKFCYVCGGKLNP